MVPEQFEAALHTAVQSDIRLVPMDLPKECPAAWVGDVTADFIGYPQNGHVTLEAVAHAVGHLLLLHCGRIRDGGRFACTDPHDQQAVTHVLPVVVEPGDDELPQPMFTDDEERGADEAAAALLARCDCWPEASFLLQPTGDHSFRCLG